MTDYPGTSGSDNFTGSTGDDTFTSGGGGNDTFNGGDGNDTFTFGSDFNSGDALDGGVGNDVLVLTGNYSAGINLSLAMIANIERIDCASGGHYNFRIGAGAVPAGHTLTIDATSLGVSEALYVDVTSSVLGNIVASGGSAVDYLSDAAGNDIFHGNGGSDWLWVTAGDDFVDGGAGDDQLYLGTGTDTALGGEGNDSISATNWGTYTVDGGAGNDEIQVAGTVISLTAGEGDDIVRLGATDGPMTIASADLSGGTGYDLLNLKGDLTITGSTFDAASSGFEQLRVEGSLVLGDASANILDFSSFELVDSGNILRCNGMAGDDTIMGTAAADNLWGDDGNDIIRGGGGDDTLNGGNGTDTLDYSNDTAGVTVSLPSMTATGTAIGNDYLYQFEIIFGGLGNDSLTANSANNVLRPGMGNDTVAADDGDDQISFTNGRLNASDVIDGGDATDLVWLTGDYTGANAVVCNATTLTNVENISVAAGFSYSLTTADATVAAGRQLSVDATSMGASNSLTFNGAAETNGTFVLLTGAGADTLSGGAGGDTFRSGGGFDHVSGNGGNDTFSFSLGHLDAADVINGGSGTDMIWLNSDYTGANAVVFNATTVTNVETIALCASYSYNLTTADATVGAGQTLTVDASSFAASKTLTFNGSAETNGSFLVIGGAGADSLIGGSGNDTLSGRAGNDTLRPGLGNDVAYGGDGNDTISFTGGRLTAADIVEGGAGTDTVWLNGDYVAGNAVVFNATTIANVETIGLAGGFSYSLKTVDATVAAGQTLTVDGSGLGASNALSFDGSAETNGSFQVASGAGADTIIGGAGNDTLLGRAGNDTLRPGMGNDIVNGGDNDDTISFTGGRLTAADAVDGGAGWDSVWLNGDYSGANAVVFGAATMINVECIGFAAGFNYSLTSNNATVGIVKTLTVDASMLGASNSLTFDGSAEINAVSIPVENSRGSAFWANADAYGHRGGLPSGGFDNDKINAVNFVAGNFIFISGSGGDNFTGGVGPDVFKYDAASRSTGLHYDTINALNFNNDSFDIPGGAGVVTGIDAAKTTGSLSTGSFDTDLAAAMSTLGAHHAILFTPNGGSLSGQTFMVVDCNGTAGYQSGQDLVIRLNGYSGALAAGAFH